MGVKADTRFQLERLPSPLGELALVLDGEGRLCTLGWTDLEERWRRDLRLRHGADILLQAGAGRSRAAESLDAYFAGELTALDGLPVDPGGTPFQRAVWSALREIPAGTRLTYAQLAARLGRPSALRAVGHANGANPISLVIPCHRLVGADGSLTGYGGGLARKRWLLAHEEGVALG
ncbi:MAG TPA: methylated-DNA--[protein]-cysteine S-methyltransferase [Holophagaceae bacterium]|nr:methylated-DNA--[protein]-cysteine S-methyltransferase [Holophagaceae bacterium]